MPFQPVKSAHVDVWLSESQRRAIDERYENVVWTPGAQSAPHLGVQAFLARGNALKQSSVTEAIQEA